MDKIQDVLKILAKAERSETELEYLDQLYADDLEIRNFIDIYTKLENIFNSSGHIDMEILSEFILYYNGDLDIANYIPEITDRIEDHLSNCSSCNNDYINLNKEYQQVDEFISRSIPEEIKDDIEFEKPESIFSRIRHANYKTFLTAIILLLITYSGMKLTSTYSTPFYKRDLFVFPELTDSSQHIRATENFKKSLTSIKSKNYDKAIDNLLDDIILDTIPSTIFYTHFILGLVYLKSSESIFLGTFKSYNHLRVDEGIQNLLSTIEKNTSGEYDSLNIKAHYYIAKGYLALDEIDPAKEQLLIVVKKPGRFYEDALEILRSFEKIE